MNTCIAQVRCVSVSDPPSDTSFGGISPLDRRAGGQLGRLCAYLTSTDSSHGPGYGLCRRGRCRDETHPQATPAVQEQLIAALLPNVHVEPPPHSPAPLPTLPSAALPTSSIDGLLVGMARIDRSGRLHERRLLQALSWMPGQRLALDVIHGLIVVRPTRSGPHVLDHRGALRLPAAARHMCGINPAYPSCSPPRFPSRPLSSIRRMSWSGSWPPTTPIYWAGTMSADPKRIATARLLLDQLGVTLDDLNHSNTTPTDQTASVPTLAEYLPHVIAAAGPGANRTYGNYWRKMLAAWVTASSTRSPPATSKLSNMPRPQQHGHGATAATGATLANTSSPPPAPSTPAPSPTT